MQRIQRFLLQELLLLVGLVVALLLGLAWWGVVRAMDAQAGARAGEGLARLQHHVEHELAETEGLGAAARDWWAQERLDPDPLRGNGEELLLPLLRQQSLITSVKLRPVEGGSLLLRFNGRDWDSRRVAPAGGGVQWTRRGEGGVVLERSGWVKGDPAPRDPARDRDCALLTGPRWTPRAAPSRSTGDPGLTYLVPVRRGERFLGVVALRLRCEELTALAWKVRPTPGSRVFILEEGNRALTLPRSPEFREAEVRRARFLTPVGPAFLPEVLGMLGEGRTAVPGHYAVLRPFAWKGLDWRFVALVPEGDLLADPRRKALGVLALAFLCLGFVAWRIHHVTHRFGAPLGALAASAEAMGRGEAPEHPPSDIEEIQTVSQALRRAGEVFQEHEILQEQLRHSQRLETVGTLAGGVAHDVNNQLMVILGQLNLCEDLLAEEHPLVPHLRRAEEATRRCADVTRALLTFSRPTASHLQSLDLNQLVRRVGGLLGRVLGGRIELVMDLDPTLAPVQGEAVKLDQVLMNLGVNARDAMPDGGTLRISTRRHPTGGALLEVRDTGQGMGPEVKARIFEPFFTTKEVGKGTGLGLSMVLGIVRGHGGSVEVESALGEGSTFRIWLPAGDAAPLEEAPRPSWAGAFDLEGLRVLLVEDEPEILAFLQEVLEGGKAEVVAAGDGQAGWERWLDSGPFDLLVTDQRMPRLTGLELLDRVRAVVPDLPAILASGYGLEEAMPRLAGDLCTRVLSKPFKIYDLHRAITGLLGRG